MKYRKKPVIVEAVQWFKGGDHGWGGIYLSPGDWIICERPGEYISLSAEEFESTCEKVEE